ncbi:MAG: ABC transporter permease [Undibacterium sp.]|nr:ABC transporter permease [Undibacterium sp.]
MIFTLIRVELLKVRRTLAILMMLACPLMVVLLSFGMLLKTHSKLDWPMYWLGNTAIWCYFMLPLYIALVTALLNGSEHRNSTWRLMMSLPITAGRLYLAKFLLAAVFVFGANLALLALVVLSIFALYFLGYPIKGAFNYDAWHSIFALSVCALPILVVQHLVSWHVKNIVAPLALGVVATMGIMQIGQSKEWVYYPWTYAMMAVHGSSPTMRDQAVLLAAVVGLGLLFLSYLWATRKACEFP